MRKLLATLMVCGTLANPVLAQAPSNPEAAAQKLLDLLDQGKFAEAEASFAPAMAQAVPEARLRQVWQSLPASAGTPKGRGKASQTRQDGMTKVSVPLHYANAELVAHVTFDANGKVAGLLIQPASTPAAAVAADAAYGERELMLGQGAEALPATLAMPKGKGPFPAVVLVHGSGPQDRDETIGPNRPFLDIARGLAQQGIAVLRYDKRTRAHPRQFAGRDFTVDQETTNDAVAAVAMLEKTPGVDPKRVFVMGHSQGAMLAPRIAAHAGNVAGVILFAPGARKLLDILLEQNQRLAAQSAGTPAEVDAALQKLDGQIKAMRAGQSGDAGALPLGLPATYWRSTDQLDPVADAKALRQPKLLLQGGRDIQVVDTDWQLWNKGLAGRKDTTFKHYPAVNHLGISGDGPATLDEYNRPGHVDPQLIADVSAWIKAH